MLARRLRAIILREVARLILVGTGGKDTSLDLTLREELVAQLLAAWGEIGEIRERLRSHELCRSKLRSCAEGVLRHLLDSIPGAAAFRQPEMQSRMIDLALDQLESEALAPPLRLPVMPRRLPDSPVHALIFNAFPHASSELYPLLVDAYTAGGRPAVGVHERWLTGSTFCRVIFLDEETLQLVEADIDDAPTIASAQVLALDLREECAAHQRIERLLRVPLLNPAAGAEKLDDKRWTGACWRQAGLPTPRFVVLSAEMTNEQLLVHISALSDLGKSLIVKPVDGTEGRGVRRISGDPDAVLATLRQSVTSGIWLLMEECGSARYYMPSGPVPCVLRLNVCWDGRNASVESSYAQVADSPHGIASVGQGGHLLSTAELWSHLADARLAPYLPQATDWHRITALAARGVQTLAQADAVPLPALIGVDLLLDVDTDGALLPLLLEANGRPSGMGHCCFTTANGPGDEPGVTTRLWQILSR